MEVLQAGIDEISTVLALHPDPPTGPPGMPPSGTQPPAPSGAPPPRAHDKRLRASLRNSPYLQPTICLMSKETTAGAVDVTFG